MVCDSIIIINRGRVVAKGTQAELVEQVFPAARVEVEVAGPAEAVVSSLRSLPGVTSVEAIGVPRDGALRFVVESPRGRDVRGELVRLIAGRGWGLLELHQVGLSLEEVFIRVVAGEEHAPQIVESVQETA
jgi:ABC-2 type transport system ATP-binding protein